MGFQRCHRSVFGSKHPKPKNSLSQSSFWFVTTTEFPEVLGLFRFYCHFLPALFLSKEYITNKATNNIQVLAPWRELSQNTTEGIGVHKTCEENTVGCAHTSPTPCLQFAPFVSVFAGSPRKQVTASL